MIWIIIGLIFFIFGIYYIPTKEAEISYYKKVNPFWFKALVLVWALCIMALVPTFFMIFIHGLVNDGYLSLEDNGLWITSIGSIILYVLILNVYNTRINNRKEQYERSKDDANSY
ncbi:hypothetical protein [Bacillus sp. FJAT-49736]|uniref:hypothetical protein n=1 Tax=Bacillus sp. FJAT-49736 TaxID=2833582 RepID=UPI001BC9A232|nr:hypothetical protein [Bacillus sp. FJAT-49736]MBS4172145.1 hypothetical protein [Bacillus sp. FJAT-49736]